MIASSCGMARSTWVTMTRTIVAAMAPMDTSVNVDRATATAASAAMPAPTYPTVIRIRSRPSATEIGAARQQRHRPHREQDQPGDQRRQRHHRR